MLAVYIGSLAFGGVLLGASILGGSDGDGDADAGSGGGDAGGGDTGHGGGGEGHHHHGGSFLPFFSLRFWAFALAFFGLSGTVMTLGGVGALTPFLAGGVGLGCGVVSARVLGSLTRKPVGLLGSAESHVGREGRVLLPVQKGRRGKIRVSIAGISSDVLAETEGEETLLAGSTALIVGVRDRTALVVHSPTQEDRKEQS